MVFLGQTAYALYLWHVPVVHVAHQIANRFPVQQRELFAQILAYAASIFIAWIVTLTIERPFMKLRDKIVPGTAK
jgi:peptidoglycan/LPS O-acetylase OafA/YrhL